jgi:hypothetical protein
MNGKKKNFKSETVLVLLSVVLSGWFGLAGEALGAEAAADKIDVATYTGMCRLRKDLDLDNETLAAMGCSESEATAALNALLGWYGSNKAEIAAGRLAKIQATRALGLALRKIGMGPRDEGLIAKIPTLKAAVAAAAKQRSDFLAAATEAVAAKLSAAQKGVWMTARGNAALPGKYRYVASLTADQVKALHRANRSFARRLASARGLTAKAAVTQKFKAAEDKVLASDQKTAMTTARTNASEKIAGAIRASKTVMPMPAELVKELSHEDVDPLRQEAIEAKEAAE